MMACDVSPVAMFCICERIFLVGHVFADISVFGWTNFPTSQILSWANLAQCPQSGGRESGQLALQRTKEKELISW